MSRQGSQRQTLPLQTQDNGLGSAGHRALLIAHHRVYIPYGGLFGDCGDYHGWVVAANASDGKIRAQYQVPTQREGAIWAPPGPAIDGRPDTP